jgi:hypothetical protein
MGEAVRMVVGRSDDSLLRVRGQRLARMLPNDDTFVRNRGELAVYRALSNAPGTESWTALHSVPLPEHRTQVIGEADFVVIVPGRAIVILEVKGWAEPPHPVNYDVWVTAKGHEEKNPYAQSAGQRSALVAALKPIPGVPVIDMVAWTRLRPASLDFAHLRNFHPDQTLFRDDLSPDRIAEAILRNLDAIAVRLTVDDRMAGTARKLRNDRPSMDDATRIVQILCPSNEVEPAPGPKSRTDDILEMLDAEQLASMEALNAKRFPRVAVFGPAGTGKTSGKRVLFVSSNEAHTSWVASQMGHVPEGLEIRTTSELLTEWLAEADDLGPLVECIEIVGGGTYYVNKKAPRFDLLVVDEAQDILGDPDSERCRFAAWMLDHALSGGWLNGEWKLFADLFQAAAAVSEDPLKTIGQFTGPVTSLDIELTRAYRSPVDVYECVRVIGNDDVLFSYVGDAIKARPDEDSEPSWQFSYYDEQSSQESRLADAIDYYVNELGYAPRDIVVLSAASSMVTPAYEAVTDARWGQRYAPLPSDCADDRIRVGHIDEFGGMDSRIVIVTDLLTDFVPERRRRRRTATSSTCSSIAR